MILSNVHIDLEKAMAAAAPRPVGMPRPGHKYVRRQWNGSRWVYEYQEDPSEAHGPFAVSNLAADLSREHSMDVQVSSTIGEEGPEADYREALKQQLSQPGVHQVAHPTQEGEQLSIEVTVNKKGKLRIRATSGDKIKDSPSRGGFERWYMGVANTTILHDREGRPWFKLLPNVGRVRYGELTPSTDRGKQFIIRFHESHPDFTAAKEAGQRVEWYKSNREGGIAHHEKELRNQELVAGPEQEEVSDEEPVGEPQGLNTELTSDQEEAAATQAGQEVPEEQTVPGSVVDRLQQGQLPYRLEAGPSGERRRRRVLDVPVEQKEQMIEEVARQFWPKIVREANAAVQGNAFFSNDPNAWLPRFIGGASFRVPAPNEMGPTGSPMYVGLEPGSMAHRAISDALDNYDPSKGHFASYLAGSSGKLHWNMRRQQSVDQFVNEAKASAPMEIQGGEEGETYERPVQQQLADIQTSGPEQEEISSTDPWIAQQDEALDQAAVQAGHISPEVHEQLRVLFNQIRSVPPDQRAAYAERFADALHSMGLEDYAVDVSKALEQAAIHAILYDFAVKKGMAVLSKDKNVQDGHTYSHKEGNDDFPKYYYTDQYGNLVQYTNAPAGHKDSSSLYSDAAMHPSEPDPTKVPQYFTPDGRKMDRSPPEGAFPEWNQTYNRYDPQNLWIGRWPNAETGDYQYAYVDSDIRSLPKLQTNRMNVMHDDRLPELRQYIVKLFHSAVFKDQMTGLALALLDQGCIRAQELAALTTSHVYIEGSLIQLGHRKIYGDSKIQYAFDVLKQLKSPSEPLFCVPVIKNDGQPDAALSRRMGPHYWARVLGQLGISLLSMQTYRASKTFSREVQRYLTAYNMPWDQAVNQALLTVSLEWGHDLSQEVDAPRVTQLVLETLIDPILVQVLQQKSQQLGIGQGQGTGAVPPATLLIPAVSMELTELTSEEQEFSQWLHSQPVHEYAKALGGGSWTPPSGGFSPPPVGGGHPGGNPYHDPQTGKFTSPAGGSVHLDSPHTDEYDEPTAAGRIQNMPDEQLKNIATSFHETLSQIQDEGRFGDRKVFLSALKEKTFPRSSPEYFSHLVTHLNKKGYIQLHRADLVGAMPRHHVAASEINLHHGGMPVGQFHFISDPSR